MRAVAKKAMMFFRPIDIPVLVRSNHLGFPTIWDPNLGPRWSKIMSARRADVAFLLEEGGTGDRLKPQK